MSRTRRVLGYARVSSAEQALGTSLRDQQAAIAAHAQASGLKVERFFVEAESGISEKHEKREQMKALLGEVRSGDLVLVAKLDRWSRDTEITLRTVRELHERDVSFYAISDACDPALPQGALMLTIRAALAKEEHARIRERMVGTRQILRDQGYYVEGRTPLGYRRSMPKGHKGLEKNVLVVVEEEAEVVRSMYRRYVDGEPMLALAAAFGMNVDRVQRILSNRLYTGELQNTKDDWIPGRHPAIVSAELFARAARIRGERRLGGPRPRHAPSETSSWLFRDLARCALCEAKMGAAYGGPKGPERRHYYRCVRKCQSTGPRSPNGSYVPVRDAEELVDAMVFERLFELREALSAGPEPVARTAALDLEGRRARLQRRRDRLHELYVDEQMTRAEHRAALDKLDAEAARLDEEGRLDARSQRLQDAPVRRALLRELGELKRAWRGAPVAVKREILAMLASAIMLENDEAPIPRWRSLEELLSG